MNYIITIILSLLAFSAMAAPVLPKGCEPIAIQGETVTFKAKQNKIIFIHNMTSNDLWITHPVTDPGASAGWSSRLQAKNWSALALEKDDFLVNCVESRPGHEQQVPCEGAIAACEWNKVTFPKGAVGTFWAGEDMALQALTASIGGRGFVMPKTKEEQGDE